MSTEPERIDVSDPVYRLRAVAFNAVGAALAEASAETPDFPELFLPLSVRDRIAQAVLVAVILEQVLLDMERQRSRG